MAKPATLSQLGGSLGEHPAQIRHHLKQLEGAGLVEMVETRVVRGFVEKYYQARARAFLLQEIILPEIHRREVIAILGSHDLALEKLAHHLSQLKRNPVELLILPVGSLDGLIALRQGSTQLAGCHLLDVESSEYNLPYVRHLFPDRDIILITLAHRQQGLLLAPGNPKGIHSLEDLGCPDVRMINRNRGSGTRLWLDSKLAHLAITPEMLRGYKREECTHTALAQDIQHGKADVGLGLAAAAQAFDLDFVPLFQERFDLALLQEQSEDPRLRPVLDYLQSAELRSLVESLAGYSAAHSGARLSI